MENDEHHLYANDHLAESCRDTQVLTGAERREWMGMGIAGININSYYGSFPHSLLSTSKSFPGYLKPAIDMSRLVATLMMLTLISPKFSACSTHHLRLFTWHKSILSCWTVNLFYMFWFQQSFWTYRPVCKKKSFKVHRSHRCSIHCLSYATLR